MRTSTYTVSDPAFQSTTGSVEMFNVRSVELYLQTILQRPSSAFRCHLTAFFGGKAFNYLADKN